MTEIRKFMPKGYLPREGDVLLLLARVKYDVEVGDTAFGEEDKGPTVWVRLIGDYQDRRVPLKEVHSVVGRTWRVGDKVRSLNDHNDRGEVVAVKDGMAWVQHVSGSFLTYAGLDLERDPALDEAEVPSAPPLRPRPAQPIEEMAASTFADEHARSVAFQEAGAEDVL